MGYSTDFEGSFSLDKPLAPEHLAYLRAFNRTRRMARNANLTQELPDPVRTAAGLPVGSEGQYFVGSTKDHGQKHTKDIVSYNTPPTGQPGLWCQWTPSEDGTEISWDGGEKFYSYVEWLEYLVAHFLKPWGYVLNGTIHWQGEEDSDLGMIVVEDNKIRTKRGRKIVRYYDE